MHSKTSVMISNAMKKSSRLGQLPVRERSVGERSCSPWLNWLLADLLNAEKSGKDFPDFRRSGCISGRMVSCSVDRYGTSRYRRG